VAGDSDRGERETTRWSVGLRLLVREGGVGRWVLWLRGEGWSVLVSGWGRGRRKKNQRERGLRRLLGEEIDLGFVLFFLFSLQTGPPLFCGPPCYELWNYNYR